MKYILIFLGVIHALTVSSFSGEVHFEPVPENPVIYPGFGGSFDAGAVFAPNIIWDGALLRMYYAAVDASGINRIALAVSFDLNEWYPVGIVFEPSGIPGTFDADGVSAPSVLITANGYEMYYTAHHGDLISIGRITSNDGFSFARSQENPVVVLQGSGQPGTFDEEGVSDPSVMFYQGYYLLMYHGLDPSVYYRLGFAVSDDGLQFTRIPGFEGLGSIFGRGPHGFDDGGALEPSVWITNNQVRLIYASLHY